LNVFTAQVLLKRSGRLEQFNFRIDFGTKISV